MYFYPRPPRGGRLENAETSNDDKAISIHALREEGDHTGWRPHRRQRISIHALREEGDKCRRSPTRRWRYFYPRPPRGGRLIGIRGPVLRQDFYPRPPRGGRRFNQNVLRLHKGFLSTPSARRATRRLRSPWHSQRYFYPRPPRGGRPQIPPKQALYLTISIHALREEGDLLALA